MRYKKKKSIDRSYKTSEDYKKMTTDEKRLFDTLKQMDHVSGQINGQIKKGVGLTLLSVGAIAGARYLYSNKDTRLNYEADQHSPIVIEEVTKNYIEENPAIIDIGDLLNDYNQAITLDEFRETNEQYNGEYVEISGEIYNNYIGSIDGDFVTLTDDASDRKYWMSVQCNFNDENEIDKIKENQVGDEVTIQGYCVGGGGSVVSIVDCKVKER